MSSVIHHENVAILQSSGASVFISAGSLQNDFATVPAAPQIARIQQKLDVAYWGEDNRFPQNIEKHIAYCGVAKSALNLKAKALFGQGIFYGTLLGYDNNGNEIIKPAMPDEFPEVDLFVKRTNLPRYFAEINQDYVYYANTFSEAIFSKDKKKITRLVAQEACDCRYKQMNDKGQIDTVYISKLWGLPKDQLVLFDRDKTVSSAIKDIPATADSKYLFTRACVDIYDPIQSIQKISGKEKSCIIPGNYPSPNKSYYQLAHWDGARLSGWIEIASKIPSLLKSMYSNGITLKYHIEIPEEYFKKRFGTGWDDLKPSEREKYRTELLQKMDEFLSGAENAYKSFISYFEFDKVNKSEINRIKITELPHKSNIDKDLITSSTANSEIFFAMELNPNILGAGQPGGVYSSNQGGSNIREADIAMKSSMYLDRQLLLEPLNIVKEFNNWPKNLVFRYKDVLQTTLDKGAQTQTQTS